MRKVWLTLMLTALAILPVACGDEGQSALPWSDDFSDPDSGWQVESDMSAEVGYDEGVLRVRVEAPNRLAWAWAERELDDFHLSIEATQVAGPDDNEYGVLARMRDAEHFYRFSISGDGYYQITKYDGQAWKPLSGDWAPSEAIRQGQAINKLEVIAQGAEMTFRVNDQELAQVEDADYRKGGIGLYAGAFFEGGVEVHFDNLEVTEVE